MYIYIYIYIVIIVILVIIEINHTCSGTVRVFQVWLYFERMIEEGNRTKILDVGGLDPMS